MPRAATMWSSTQQRTTTDDEADAGTRSSQRGLSSQRGANMAKPLRHTKSGTKEVQRLLGRHIAQALKALRGNQPLSDAAVHGARKQLKKARADLRLLRQALAPQTYHYENTALRDVARPL